MQSFRQPEAPTLPKLSVQLPIATELLISLSSLPLVSFLAIGQATASTLTEIGQASEELFRGDRLPSLPLMTRESNTSF